MDPAYVALLFSFGPWQDCGNRFLAVSYDVRVEKRQLPLESDKVALKLCRLLR
jgi:hypothetical protein